VRRTAGDALSDLGDARARRDDVPNPGGSLEAYAVESRGSSMRLAIRLQWNLQRAQQHESEFDVRVEMLAIERIEGRWGWKLKYVDAHRQGCWVVEFTNRSSLIAFKVCCRAVG